MSKIKNNNTCDKVKVGVSTHSGTQKVSFGFSHLVNNNDYNFKYFKKEKTKKLEAYEKLEECLYALSGENWVKIQQMPKNSGIETITLNKMNKNAQAMLKGTNIVSDDSKLIIIRFCNDNYRMICKADINNGQLLHILAYDFKLEAYDH